MLVSKKSDQATDTNWLSTRMLLFVASEQILRLHFFTLLRCVTVLQCHEKFRKTKSKKITK